MKEALKQIIDFLQPVAALTDRTPFEHSEVIQRCVDASEIALEALAQSEQEPVALQYPQKDIDWQQEQQIKAQASISPQCPWVNLEPEDRLCAKYMFDAPEGIEAVIDYITTKLKELNT